MRFINLTPHLMVIKSEKRELILAGTKKPARLWSEYTKAEPINNITCVKRLRTSCTNTPKSQKDIWYIVSALVFDAFPERNDLVCPDTDAGAVRDSKGFIRHITRLVRR